MSKKIIFIVVILIILFSIFFLRNETEPMVNPAAAPLPSSEINQPKEVKYDSSTDLMQELESINPAVSESDFE